MSDNNMSNLFCDIRDMVFMSAYIYEHANLIKEAPWWKFWASKEKDGLLQELISFSPSKNNNNKSIKDMLLTFERHEKADEKGSTTKNKLLDEQIKLVSEYSKVEEKEREANVKSKKKDNIIYQEKESLWTTENKILEINANSEDERTSCVYAITKDSKYHRIVVTFRGSSNVWDYLTDISANMTNLDNPVIPLSDNTPKIALHAGFARALNEEKIKAILKKVKAYIKQEESIDKTKKYRLCVTGHSLGGALATILGFYAAASADPVYTKNGPVNIISYSSPRVGTTSFLKSFQYLEEEGSLRHARVRNMKDPITMAPYLWGTYRHVGMEIKLRDGYRPLVNYPLRQLDVPYIKRISAALKVLTFHGCAKLYERIQKPTTRRIFWATNIEAEYRKKLGLDPTIFTTGEHLSSEDKPLIFPKTGVSLNQENNGKLVLYDIEKEYKLWESGMDLKKGEYYSKFYTKFQHDGNLLTRPGSPDDKPKADSVWTTMKDKENGNYTKTNKGLGNYFLVLSPDKKMLSIRKNSPTSDKADDVVWETCTKLGEKMKHA